MKQKERCSISVKPLASYDLSRKSDIVFQEIDPEKQAEELERLRKEIADLNESSSHSRLYSQGKRYLLFIRSLQEFFKLQYISTP